MATLPGILPEPPDSSQNGLKSSSGIMPTLTPTLMPTSMEPQSVDKIVTFDPLISSNRYSTISGQESLQATPNSNLGQIINQNVDYPTIQAESHLPRNRYRLPKEGVLWFLVSIALLLVGMVKSINLIILMSYFLFGSLLANLILGRFPLKRIQARFLHRHPLFAGVPSLWEIQLQNTYHRTIQGFHLTTGVNKHLFDWFCNRLEPGESRIFRAEIVIPHRGICQTTPLLISSSYPFGLIHRSQELIESTKHIILPKGGEIYLEGMRRALSYAIDRSHSATQGQRYRSSQEAEIHGLRPFRTGDSPRWIHWPSTARRNQLIVREFENTAPPALALIIDPWLPAQPNQEDLSRLDWLIDFAAAIVQAWCREPEFQIAMVINGIPPKVHLAGTGADHALSLLTDLAIENGHSLEFRFEWLSPTFTRNMGQWLFLTSKNNSTDAEELSHRINRKVVSIEAKENLYWYQA